MGSCERGALNHIQTRLCKPLVRPGGWSAEAGLPTGEHYYLNVLTKESQWDVPTEPATDIPMAAAKGQVWCSHLLVKHRDSRRPSSWREEKITRSKEEALDIIKGYREQIASGKATFEELATQFSDCSSAKNKGDLGTFGRGAMQKPFEEAAFALNVGELSEPVFTDSGVHLILRTA
ncbi:peptidyl-prolyl cis-trans isomerase, putative [Ixodes scapularis]|uniref:Peptidyl-prolyl cis-trans isomerase n=1 Tax=Ixodes scapularis TaxID=6945 RepID=B7PAM5_IXOSC|nr:peptidyl-prolyl cis-trans isomerase, putative [Ixodes scapularis]|eukprot:XP_002407024.1 peptidyl-prolyl cis-trans isomerase, putative [Ixodes scapularis]